MEYIKTLRNKEDSFEVLTEAYMSALSKIKTQSLSLTESMSDSMGLVILQLAFGKLSPLLQFDLKSTKFYSFSIS